MMKWLGVVCLFLGTSEACVAQESNADWNAARDAAPRNLSNLKILSVSLAKPSWAGGMVELPFPGTSSFAPLTTATFSAPLPPAPEPKPKFVYGSRDDYRVELGVGVSVVRLRTSAFYATAVGTNTSLVYFTNEWLGIEGDLTTGFAQTVYANEHIKFLSYGAGPKIAWRQRQWEPWVHAIFGGAHLIPQTANNSQNALAIQLGGGADYRWTPRVSLRLDADLVFTRFFSQSQNSAQITASFVFHF